MLDAVLAGDRAALGRLVAREHAWLVRLARSIVRDQASADEVVQEGWISIIRGLPSFEGRCSLRSWMATIVVNRAKTTAVRGARTVPIASFDEPLEEEDVVDRSRFNALGFWSQPPLHWQGCTPEVTLHRREMIEAIEVGLEQLPPNQRAVVTLRDVQGWSSEEVCNALSISESNQRVLLHRARAKLRTLLEATLGEEASS